MNPSTTALHQNDTHRLIPTKWDAPVLDELADNTGEFAALSELERATNDRVLHENNLLPGISNHELVFGLPYWHIVNAAFCYSAPGGARFNPPDRGAWYAGFELETAQSEVAFHRSKELKEIAAEWGREEVSDYVDYLADFRAEFHDIRGDVRFQKCLDPESYAASQHLAATLLQAGAQGIVYPSVRHAGGTCVGCFRPAIVTNVRRGREFRMSFGKDAELKKILPI
ncbi:MAG: RES family NAD+ phosphorylase [Terriglobales bacterium]|jgi:RES domain-containing protein